MNLSESAEIRNKEYRHGLVDAQIEIDLPLQIRALRKQLVGTQPELSRLTGMKQSRISDMEKPGKVHFSLETLRRLAEAFDVALVVRFAPFSEFMDWSGKFNPDAFRIPSFTEEVHESIAPEQPEKVAETRPRLPLAGLTPSPEDRAQWDKFRESANQSLQTYLDNYVGKGTGLANPYANLASLSAKAETKGISAAMPDASGSNMEDGCYKGLRLVPKPAAIEGLNPSSMDDSKEAA